MACPACGSDKKTQSSKTIRDGKPGKTRRATLETCSACGLVKLADNEMLGPDYYESGDYAKQVKQKTNWEDYLHHLNLLLMLTGEPDNKSVLDIGAGNGEFTRLSYNLFRDVDDVDLFNPWEITKLYNIITSFNMIEHVIDPLITIKGVYDLLIPGGQTLICTPNLDYIHMEHEAFRQFFYRSQHNWYFSGHTLGKLLDRAGFADIKLYYHDPYGLNNPMITSHLHTKTINEAYKQYLCQNGKAYYVYALASKPA